MSQAFDEALSKAKIKVMASKNSCFLANVAMRLRYEATDDIRTAAIDGVTMYFNEDFFMNKLTPETRVTTLLHEVGHVTRQHTVRRGSRDPQVFNEAGDYVINQELKDAGWTPIEWVEDDGRPNGWLQDDRFKDMHTEKVYEILMQEYQNQPPPPSSGMFADLGMPPPSGMSQEQVQAAITDIIIASAQAARMAGQAGSIPGEVQVYLDGLLQPKLPLAHHLRRFFKVLAAKSFTWARPNRRHQARGLYLPAIRGKSLCHIAFGMDMSGSVSDADIKRYVSELVGVIKQLKPTKLTLVQFDTRIISVDEITTVNDLLKIELKGRGGTNIMPIMDWAHREKPEALVIFSDGEFNINSGMNPHIPVLWMIHGGTPFYCEFGQTTMFEV